MISIPWYIKELKAFSKKWSSQRDAEHQLLLARAEAGDAQKLWQIYLGS